VPWKNTFVFWADERSVPTQERGSNFGQAYRSLFRHVRIPRENLQRIKGEITPQKAALDYAHILKSYASPPLEWPRFDLVLLGMGADGHTASLFPGSPYPAESPTLAVSADYQGRPAQRVTLSETVFNSARQVLFMVSGESKAATLSRVLEGKYRPDDLPAQRIRPSDGELTWLIDQDAAGKLNHHTLK
jgi:6-phosphogluconolactonase